MKHKYILIFLLVMGPALAFAQFGNIINKVKTKTSQRADNKVDNAIDKMLDKAEGKGKKQSTDTNDSNEEVETESKPQDTGVKSFAKFDFIPGEQILYAEDFASEEMGELPIGWNTNGSAEVTTLDKYKGNWLKLHKNFSYLTANAKEFGTDYTMEFDIIFQFKNNGWGFPQFSFGPFSSGDKPSTDNSLLKGYHLTASALAEIFPGTENKSYVHLESKLDRTTYFNGSNKDYGSLDKFYSKPIHISIQVQKERYRMWINADKLFDAPKAVPLSHKMNQMVFAVSGTNYAEEDYGIYIGNIKIATGKPDTRHKLIETGKFTTTGILFDFQSAVIKPESYGVIKEIAAVLKENADVKIKVIGHTSNDGDDAANMELSRKRSASVKEMLVKEFSIGEDRLTTEGKGETQPIADNKTREGKAANRRVEFIKL